MVKLTLRHKINNAILITFIVISLIFISIQLLLQNRRNDSVSEEMEVLLQMVVEREREALANEITQGLIPALTLRLDQIRGKGNIFLISVFDKTGRLLVSRGKVPESATLTKAEISALSNDTRVRQENWQGIYAMVYLQRIESLGEQAGFIRICYSLEPLKREQRASMMILVALLVSILAVMLILLNLIMSRTIVKQYLSNIINSMPSILLGVDNRLNITQWNLHSERITGIAPESAIGRPLTEVLPQIAGSKEMVHQALRENAVRKKENVLWEMDGKPAYLDITVYPLITSGAEGAAIRVDDVTDRRQTQEALRESQEKYRLVAEHANDAIFIIQDGLITFANQNTETMSGYTAAELAARPFISYVSEMDKALVAKTHADRMKGEPAPANYSFRVRNKSGNQLWVNASSVLISWNNRPATLNFLRDISDQKKAEEQLLHAQTMEAIGTLAGGIAHDFNNLLQVIQGYAQLLLFHKEDRSADRRELEAILNAARKGGELTMQLLTFGRNAESRPQAVDINVQVEKTEKMLSRTIPKMIEIDLRLAKGMPTVFADPGQIEQVVMNLVLNARDAMPEGGRILLETECVNLGEDDAKRYLVPNAGRYIRLGVSDTGQGIAKKVQDHIFEPFFTTKKLGDGTGLGLAIVYGIVKNHNGSIHCYSIPGEGTTFRVYLPAGTSSAAPPREILDRVVPIVGGTETILLVDDEDAIRDIGRQMLETFGYKVLTASDAEEALEIYASRQERVHLVILDLVMPGMGGGKCVDALLELNPEARIVIASGYFGSSGSSIVTEVDLKKVKGFIKKPFVLEGMLQEVRQVLDE